MSLRSIAIWWMQVGFYTAVIVVYLRLGGNVSWVISAGIAYGWFVILRRAWTQWRERGRLKRDSSKSG